MIAVVLLNAMLAQQPLHTGQFANSVAGEGIAVITASCDRCDWGVEGREAAALRIVVDGRYSQHLLLVRGDRPSEYRLTLGRVSKQLEFHAVADRADVLGPGPHPVAFETS